MNRFILTVQGVAQYDLYSDSDSDSSALDESIHEMTRHVMYEIGVLEKNDLHGFSMKMDETALCESGEVI